jgi:hypothetical protein
LLFSIFGGQRMRGRGEVPGRLLRLEQRFLAWRTTRTKGQRIPERLWKSAAEVAKDCGLNPTAKVLKLDYYSLKKRVDQQLATPTVPGRHHASAVSFVELPSAPSAYASECLIEFEDAGGGSLRVHLKGSEVPDVLALGRSFWNAE